ncbi:hypothetical protein CC1G_10001 [Coprinopsis cinerea okayama7|uniref:Uncharacterized protein n=1 Tax=Coprinopsis cinerea (strain Okayama-7 / 130 / ATCC MYA-4618 / FGSC 9003) TaxID=240176 RepID=A8NDJ4_COPC7|nr:hypothetical protein CC1G_10001 [Coprinopsis cinerea okayama7\|eukprot:XP_001832787.1 hypothetical protein CC1G_10001 [Coprinopsis cinerea okayama7\
MGAQRVARQDIDSLRASLTWYLITHLTDPRETTSFNPAPGAEQPAPTVTDIEI